MTGSPRVIVVMGRGGLYAVYADAPVEVIECNADAEFDRFYRLTEGRTLHIGRAGVETLLAGETVGHANDGQDHLCLTGHGKRGGMA